MHSGQFTALLDANVLYPFFIRDLLLSLAEEYLYRPKWSDDIEKEWTRNLMGNRPDIKPELILHTVTEMNRSFKDAKVIGYEELVRSLSLPDPDDRHVLAAAIVSRSDVIVTFNLKDFDRKELSKYNIEAVHPDDFTVNILDLDDEKAKSALEKMVRRRKNPPVALIDLINRAGKSSLPKSEIRLRMLFNL
ncbi:MAG: PIN domain-containing protein [Balneolaceae bacterium]